MKTFRIILLIITFTGGGILLSAYKGALNDRIQFFPYPKEGLTKRQAAAHLLNRFTYGATPGQVDEVVNMGLENWFMQQLKGDLKDEVLDKKLSVYDAIHLSNAEVLKMYPKNGQLIKMAVKSGVLNKDSLAKPGKKEYRDRLTGYMLEQGLKPRQELFRQFINQKILRAAYTNNQLQEVLTDFWFNHFNVSITKAQCAEFIPAYERDVIRPNVLGKFSDLLIATAKSPAMLFFLDNSSSAGIPVTIGKAKINKAVLTKRIKRGINENYAREVMELHTLGVDGGYTQQDVTEAARVLTGWTVGPSGEFLFSPNRHDNSKKIVLGKEFPAGKGYSEGEELLNMLARNPTTAKFISTKLAVRFVSDHPSPELINKMAEVFTRSNGDIEEVLLTIVTVREFWSSRSVGEKTKSPFELAISTVRSLQADIKQPYQLYSWITRMGQKMYYYQAPTGFPDNGQYWINTGSLLSRMNFGLAIASEKIPGIRITPAILAKADGVFIGSPEFQKK